MITEIIDFRKKRNTKPSNLTNENEETISDPVEVANIFNNFFVNIGQNMANLIKPVDKNTVIQTKDATNNYNSLFIAPSTPQEVQSIIKQFNVRKATWEYDVETKFIKMASQKS